MKAKHTDTNERGERVGNTWEIVVELRGHAKYFWHLCSIMMMTTATIAPTIESIPYVSPLILRHHTANSCQLCWSWKSPSLSPCHWANGSCFRLSLSIHECESLHWTSTPSNTRSWIDSPFSVPVSIKKFLNNCQSMDYNEQGELKVQTPKEHMSTNFAVCECHPLQHTVVVMD